MKFDPIWFDSMGAKSSCVFVETSDTSILIDPGAAIMQPSFPISEEAKLYYLKKAEEKIKETASKAEHVVISHYHYDHFKVGEGAETLYHNKELWIKDPNQWINHSQWKRSRKFLKWLSKIEERKLHYEPPGKKYFEDPIKEISVTSSRDFGDQQQRREELLEKWQKRFSRLQRDWTRLPWIEPGNSIHFADSSGFISGDTKVRFSPPLFHGTEYANTGWTIATIIEDNEKKLIHTSDLQGPVIEEHARWIIDEDPDILILDGPPTYLLGHLLSTKDLDRSIDNAISILKECDLELMIYDHHLLRDKHYRERTARVWDSAQDRGIKIMTASEFNGSKPVVLESDQTGKKRQHY